MMERILAEQRKCLAYIQSEAARKGHPLGTEDVDGARRGLDDWVMEEVLMRMEYRDFLERKMQHGAEHGFAPLWMPDFLFDFQVALVEWALVKGRAAIFADCLGAESVINSPDGDIEIGRAHRDGKPLRVYSIDNGQPCIKTASAPFISGVGDLYQYMFASGRQIIASKRHRFLSASGWKRGGLLTIGERLLVSDVSRLRSNLGCGLLARGGGGQRSSETDVNLTDDCSSCLRPYGGRPLPVPDISRGVFPSEVGVREHIRPHLRVDDSDNESRYSRQNPLDDRPAIDHCGSPVATIGATSEYRPLSFDRACTGANSQTFPQVPANTSRDPLDHESLPSAEQQFSVFQFSAYDRLLEFDTLVAIQYIRFDRHFDIEVPGTECFLADGIWSHNCGLGKTPMQLVWAENVVRKTNKPVLILTPLAVAQQTTREAAKFGIECSRSAGGINPGARIVVTNYEKLHHFSPDDFGAVVCDESSILKHFSGATQKAVTRFMLKIPYRLLCTATAAPNDYIELGTSSEALGELGHSDMLTRFFRQTDNKPHRLQEIKEWRQGRQEKLMREVDGNHFQKLSYRVHQSIGQWRLKGHAEVPFWRWVASWARACRAPSDLGFDDGKFILPELVERNHIIEPKTPPDGMLFTIPALGLRQERDERRRTIEERCELVAELVDHDRPAVVWCHLNIEGDKLEKAIPDAVQVKGSTSDNAKEEAYRAFAAGEVRVLVIKPKIGAWGLNWQHCNHVVTFATHSYEQFYQSVRRCWRFGQEKPVTVDIVATTGEKYVRENMMRKAAAATEMFAELVKHMNDSMKIKRTNNAQTATEVPKWL